MSTIFYFSSVSTEYYSTQALDDYVNILQQNNIKTAANALGVSATAIAGAMAEENNDYWHKQTINDLSDRYALSDVGPSDMVTDYLLLDLDGALAKFAGQTLFGTRTHEQWVAD